MWSALIRHADTASQTWSARPVSRSSILGRSSSFRGRHGRGPRRVPSPPHRDCGSGYHFVPMLRPTLRVSIEAVPALPLPQSRIPSPQPHTVIAFSYSLTLSSQCEAPFPSSLSDLILFGLGFEQIEADFAAMAKEFSASQPRIRIPGLDRKPTMGVLVSGATPRPRSPRPKAPPASATPLSALSKIASPRPLDARLCYEP